MRTTASVNVLRTLPELEAIRREWQSWPGNRDSEMESYLTLVRTNPETLRPHVLAVYREGRPDAILVGRIDKGRIRCRLGYFEMGLGARVVRFGNGALRGNPSEENCELLVKEILLSLSLGEADAAHLSFLRKGSDLCRLSTTKPGPLFRDYLRTPLTHFTSALPTTPEEFYSGLSSGARWQAKSKQKKLLKAFGGNIRIRCFREPAEVETLIQDVERVAKKSYQRGLGVGFIDSPKMREQLRLKAERGWLRGYVLYLADRPCSFWIGDINQGAFGSDYLAYDAEFEKYSPGMCLILKVIEGFCDENPRTITEVDFATGYAQYKEVLSNRKWEEEDVHIFAPTIKGVSLNLVRSFFAVIDQAGKKLLASTNLLQKFKKRWRARARLSAAAQS
ncbi:MAG: GNAT family N-acetyltransferase [Terriglobales bacterium]